MSADVRDIVRQRIATGSHWMIAADQDENQVVEAALALIRSRDRPGAEPMPIEIFSIDIVCADLDDGSHEHLGVFVITCIPRPALSAEEMQGLIRREHGAEVPVEALLEAPFLTPICPSDVWRVGEQLKAITAWLGADDEGEGGDGG